jgi:hypothetical protein
VKSAGSGGVWGSTEARMEPGCLEAYQAPTWALRWASLKAAESRTLRVPIWSAEAQARDLGAARLDLARARPWGVRPLRMLLT